MLQYRAETLESWSGQRWDRVDSDATVPCSTTQKVTLHLTSASLSYTGGLSSTASHLATQLPPDRWAGAGQAGQPPHMATIHANQPAVLLSHINESATIRSSQPNRPLVFTRSKAIGKFEMMSQVTFSVALLLLGNNWTSGAQNELEGMLAPQQSVLETDMSFLKLSSKFLNNQAKIWSSKKYLDDSEAKILTKL